MQRPTLSRRKTPFLGIPTSIILILAVLLLRSNSAAVDTFVYVGCSRLKFSPGTPYESNVNSLLSTIINAAAYSTFGNFTAGGSIHGLFQCRPDLSSSDCASCVTRSVSRLSILCADSVGGALQLDGCFIRYDNATFFGVEDKTVVVKRCGPQSGDSDELNRRDAVLGYLASGGDLFRVGGSGGVRGVALCDGDLTVGQCGDCLGDAIGRLKSECGSATWADVFLAKCYARYSVGGTHAPGQDGSSTNDEETEKTLAILIGLIAVVALIIIFASFLRKACEDKGGK